MFGLVENTLYKIFRKSKLGSKELEEVLRDAETPLNNKPLTYIEADIQLSVLIPYLLVLGKTPVIPNKDPTDIENKDLRKKKYMQRCKKAAWKRLRNEYLTSFRETQSLKYKKREPEVEIGEVVIIEGHEQGSVETDVT